MTRVRARRLDLKMSQREVTEKIIESGLIVRYSQGSYRTLEQNYDHPATCKLSLRLLQAIAYALDTTTDTLATPRERDALPLFPQKLCTWQDPELGTDVQAIQASRVASPETVVKRVKAYAELYGYPPKDLAARVTVHGYRISHRTLTAMYRREAKAMRHVNQQFVDAVTRTLDRSNQPAGHKFEREWLLLCKDTCPHCHQGWS